MLKNKKIAEQEIEIKNLKAQILQLERRYGYWFLEAGVDLFISGHTRRLERVDRAAECPGLHRIKGKCKLSWHYF